MGTTGMTVSYRQAPGLLRTGSLKTSAKIRRRNQSATTINYKKSVKNLLA
jgi:hypothetical protein